MKSSISPVLTTSSDESLPELSDLDSSVSTFQSSSSISSIETESGESASSSPELQQQQTRANSNGSVQTRTSSDTRRITSTSRRRIQARHNHRLTRSTTTRRYSTSVLVLNNLLQFSLNTIMNAAITIFGVGIGVGIILADSFRGPTDMGNSAGTASHADARQQRVVVNEHATITVSAATPTCRATIRRAMDRIQEAPPISLASMSTMPAQ